MPKDTVYSLSTEDCFDEAISFGERGEVLSVDAQGDVELDVSCCPHGVT